VKACKACYAWIFGAVEAFVMVVWLQMRENAKYMIEHKMKQKDATYVNRFIGSTNTIQTNL
jgi:hypothetical protein